MKQSLSLCIALLLLLGSCASEQQMAEILKIEDRDGYTRVEISDPWHKGKLLHAYNLVERSASVPDGMPDGTLVRTPVERAVVYSTVHVSVLDELGCFDAVKGMTDVQYVFQPKTADAIKRGDIIDCGNSMNPTTEQVIALKPDAIMLSPYQDGNYGQVTKLGIPIIECADYMEHTPLARAEWIKFYGALVSKRAEAEAIYDNVTKQYNDLKATAKIVDDRPTVISEMVISGIWNVPGGKSYMAEFFKDAGAAYPWADDNNTGSLSLDFNQVLARAKNADVWLVKAFNIHSLADLREAYELNDRFDAFQNHNVWVCDTQATNFYEEFPFHPERLLREYINIFHPGTLKDSSLRYYHRLDK